VEVRFCAHLAVWASRAAGLGAGAERLVHDFLNRAGAAAALGAATETAIDLPRCAGRHRRLAYCITDVVVGKNVAGTNDHETAHRGGIDGLCSAPSIFKMPVGCKRKSRILKVFQTAEGAAPRHKDRRFAIALRPALIMAEMRRLHSLIIQAKYETFLAAERLPAIGRALSAEECLLREVKP
jgi:hypothetical protein